MVEEVIYSGVTFCFCCISYVGRQRITSTRVFCYGVEIVRMKVTRLGGTPRSSLMMVVYLGMALFVAIGGVAFAWITLGHAPKAAHAAGITFQQTLKQPWGMQIDGAGNIWVGEPNCNANPFCTLPLTTTGSIGEYSDATFTKIADFIPPTPALYAPLFVAVNGGNIWFTDSTNHAIGELKPSGKVWTEYDLTKAPNSIAGAVPVDLAFDKNGNLWYTDFATGAIGEFNTTSHTATETATPTAGTAPYGITLSSDGKTIWFTENNLGSVGSFVAPATGGLTKAGITEHTFTAPAGTTPHLITTDSKGNAWFSTGFGGQIGEVPAAGGAVQLFCVSTTVTSPHISGVAVDSKGNVWFDDSLNNRLGFLAPASYANDCTTNSSVGVTYTNLTSRAHDGLIVDSHDNIFFAEQFAQLLGEVPAGTILPPAGNSYPPGPTAKTWYFAEGRVGSGFQEFITIDNPSTATACTVDVTYLLEAGSPIAKQYTVVPSSRATISVNNDVNNTQPSSATGISVATLLKNDPTSACPGFAAERPMYFNYHGDTSNSDVVGATHLNTSFYFADVPSGGGYTSYLTILNPPGGQTATVTANYFANGAQVGTQSVLVSAGQRGTIAPGAIALPQHSAVVVTSTKPVVIERPTYFTNISGGIAGNVTGASSVVGSQTLQNEFFFAEGYAGTNSSGGSTDERLVISNLDSVNNKPASVTIKLDYINGTQHPFTVTVAPKSQLIWDVNTNGISPASPEVSADVVATGAAIVASRQMFFNYAHTLLRGTLHVVGGTEVTGLSGQMGTFASYSFAEGYSNLGYNEWLTIQNPTTTAETVYITMINGYGRVHTVTLSVGANTRATVDVTNTVLTTLVQPGDDHRGYEVSMTVQTLTGGGFFVAERPMYVNTYGVSSFATQGGNDAIGYNGQ